MSSKRITDFVEELSSDNRKTKTRADRVLVNLLFNEKRKDATMKVLSEKIIKGAIIENDANACRICIAVFEEAAEKGADISGAVDALLILGYQKDNELLGKAAILLAKGCVEEKSQEQSLSALCAWLKTGRGTTKERAAWALWYAASHGVDVSSAVPLWAKALNNDNGEITSSCIDILMNPSVCEQVRRPFIYALIKELGNEDDAVRFFVCLVLKKADVHDRGELNVLLEAAREAKKERKDTRYFSVLYSEWSKKLDEKAGKLVADKKFHVPKIEPDKTERVLRVRRSCS